MLIEVLTTLTTAVLLPIVSLAMVILLPFADRKTQALQMTTYSGLLAVIAGVLV